MTAFIFSFDVQANPASSAAANIAAFAGPYLTGLILLMGALPLLLAAVGRPLGPDVEGGIDTRFQVAAILLLVAGVLIILSRPLLDLPLAIYVVILGIDPTLALGDCASTE